MPYDDITSYDVFEMNDDTTAESAHPSPIQLAVDTIDGAIGAYMAQGGDLELLRGEVLELLDESVPTQYPGGVAVRQPISFGEFDVLGNHR